MLARLPVRIQQNVLFEYSHLARTLLYCLKTWEKGVEIGCEQDGHSQVNRLYKVHKKDNSSPFLGTTYFHSARSQLNTHYIIYSGPLELLVGFLVDLAKGICER